MHMRGLALALISAGLLAACGQGGTSGGAFPDLNGHYRAEATITPEQGAAMPVVMIRDGDKVRMEFNHAEGQMAVVNGGASGESFVLVTRDGQTMAMRGMDQQIEDPSDGWRAEVASTATRTGSCSVAGENGSEWTTTGEDGVARAACVTDDGIILRSKEGERTVWETTSVSRGPQDAALFTVPPGVQVLDTQALMQGLGAAMQGAASGDGAEGNAQLCTTLRNAGAPADALSRAGC
jgi:major membrane immunogen (membrane-anchored lipoprotein)